MWGDPARIHSTRYATCHFSNITGICYKMSTNLDRSAPGDEVQFSNQGRILQCMGAYYVLTGSLDGESLPRFFERLKFKIKLI